MHLIRLHMQQNIVDGGFDRSTFPSLVQKFVVALNVSPDTVWVNSEAVTLEMTALLKVKLRLTF